MAAAPTRTRGASSAARSSCRSRRCSATSTRTSGSTSAASRTSSCASKGIDYFENSRRAAYAQRAYAIAEPDALARLRREIWGLTACDGPADTVQIFNDEERGFFTYAARGTGRDAPARRRHDRADRGGRLDRLRAGDRDPDDPRDARALRRAPLPEVRLPRRVQPELHVHRRAAAPRPDRRRTSAGSTPTISASTRARSWR